MSNDAIGGLVLLLFLLGTGVTMRITKLQLPTLWLILLWPVILAIEGGFFLADKIISARKKNKKAFLPERGEI